jgi:hypothetical protein
MTKPKRTIEVLRPAKSDARENFAIDRLADAVLQRIMAKEADGHNRQESEQELSESVLMQPWCLPPEVARAIRRLIPVWHWHKHSWVYEDNGCFKCDRDDVPHQSLGMCQSCYARYISRVKSSIVKRAGKTRLSVKDVRAALTLPADSARKILEAVGTIRKQADSKIRKSAALPASTRQL